MSVPYFSYNELIAVGASPCWANATVFTGKLYDDAFSQRRNGGSSSGGFAEGEFNGKKVSCFIVPRCMRNGKWSSTTRWKINGKRISQKLLVATLCE